MGYVTKAHEPSRHDAKEWSQFALLAQGVATGNTRRWRALREAAKRAKRLTVFGHNHEFNTCLLLIACALECAESTDPETHYADLDRLAGDVLGKYKKFEQVRLMAVRL